MTHRSLGAFVRRWLSIPEAASSVEWHRERMREAIALGIVPAFRLRTGETVVPVATLGVVDRRLHEHDL